MTKESLRFGGKLSAAALLFLGVSSCKVVIEGQENNSPSTTVQQAVAIDTSASDRTINIPTQHEVITLLDDRSTLKNQIGSFVTYIDTGTLKIEYFLQEQSLGIVNVSCLDINGDVSPVVDSNYFDASESQEILNAFEPYCRDGFLSLEDAKAITES